MLFGASLIADNCRHVGARIGPDSVRQDAESPIKAAVVSAEIDISDQ